MDILELSIEDTPIADAMRVMTQEREWPSGEEVDMEELTLHTRRLVAGWRHEFNPALPHDLERFLDKVASPWGLAILRDVPTEEPRKSFLLLSEILGQTVRFEDEGDYLIEIKEDPSALVKRPGFNNSKEFFPHTDLSYVLDPPVFFCLHSIVNEREQGGFSEFVDLRDLTLALDSVTLTALRQSDFLFPAPKHFHGGSAVRQAVLSTSPAGLEEIRFRRDNLRCITRSAIDAVVALCKLIQETMVEIFLEPGCVAVIDNRRVLHGRTAFLGGALARAPRHINRLYFEPRNVAFNNAGAAGLVDPQSLEPLDGAFSD